MSYHHHHYHRRTYQLCYNNHQHYTLFLSLFTSLLSSYHQPFSSIIHTYISYLIICRTLKDVKRRATQSVLATVGAAESTKDEDFDAHMEHFTSMLQDMNECKLLVMLMMYACMYCI